MQKFGLQRNSSASLPAIELEIAKEQASALGHAGKKLRLSHKNYQNLLNQGLSTEDNNDSIKEIANNVWELVLQREFVGFIEGNLKWVRENNLIPDQAINMLGKQN